MGENVAKGRFAGRLVALAHGLQPVPEMRPRLNWRREGQHLVLVEEVRAASAWESYRATRKRGNLEKPLRKVRGTGMFNARPQRRLSFHITADAEPRKAVNGADVASEGS